jgi:hypothetical protein
LVFGFCFFVVFFSSLIIKKTNPKMSSDYSTFGKPYSQYPQEDPANACMPDRLLSAPWDLNTGYCDLWMPQRCANNWDKKCDIYYKNIRDFGNMVKFVEGMADQRFCNLAADSSCTIACEPLDPIQQSSPSLCTVHGIDPMMDTSGSIDTGLYSPLKISPTYMGKCRRSCNKIKPENIKPNDIAINNCLEKGLCKDTLNNICVQAKQSKSKLQHPLLQKYCTLNTLKQAVDTAQSLPKTETSSQFDNKEIMTSNPTPFSDNWTIIAVLIGLLGLSVLVFMSQKGGNKSTSKRSKK